MVCSTSCSIFCRVIKMSKFDKNCPPLPSGLKCKILDLLPQQFPYLIVSANNETSDGFSCLLRLSIDNKNDALNWKDTFEEQSLATYRVSSSFEENTQKLVYKKRFHCHHNTRPNSNTTEPHTKHTGCTSRLTITVKQKNMKRSKDQYLKQYPCEIDIYFVHNHLINNAEALRHRNPTQELEDIFSQYFANNEIYTALKETFNILENKLLNDRQTFEAPVRQFINSFKNIKTDSGLISALHTFGKYNGAGMPLIKKGNNLQGSKIIGVQPTAIARRKLNLSGRKAQITGRPPKTSRIEHAYTKRKTSSLDLPCAEKKKAPHSIEECVVQNVSLGKQH